MATKANGRWQEVALQFCTLASSPLGHLAIEHGSDWGVADEIAVGDKQQGGRDNANKDDFRQAWNGPSGHPNLQDLNQRQVGDIEPIGGVGNEADLKTFSGEERTEHPDETENHQPDEKC